DLGEHDEPFLALVVAGVARDAWEDAYLVRSNRPTGDDRVPRACAVPLEVRVVHGVVVTERRRELAGLVPVVVRPHFLQGPDVGGNRAHARLDRTHARGPRPVPTPEIPRADAYSGRHERSVARVVAAGLVVAGLLVG